MRFVVLHCHNVACGHRIWLPVHKLGALVRCSECGQPYQTPSAVPTDQFVEGPDIAQEVDSRVTAVPLSRG